MSQLHTNQGTNIPSAWITAAKPAQATSSVHLAAQRPIQRWRLGRLLSNTRSLYHRYSVYFSSSSRCLYYCNEYNTDSALQPWYNSLMQEGYLFPPERREGLVFHLGILLSLASVAGWGIWQTLRPASQPIATIAPLITLFAFGLMLLFAYRLYVLLTASYHVENEGILLRWGWRQIAIPMEHILGVQRPRGLGMHLRFPWMRWPGNVVGTRRDEVLGEVEFLATNTRNLVLIVTERKAYAISPENGEAFLHTFQRFAEMGTLASLEMFTSPSPNAFTQLWEDKIARALACAMFLASASYFAWVEWGLVRPQSADVGMQVSATGGQAAFAIPWRLLAWLNALILMINFVMGAVAWQKMGRRVYTYLIWGIGLVVVVLFYYGSIVQIK